MEAMERLLARLSPESQEEYRRQLAKNLEGREEIVKQAVARGKAKGKEIKSQKCGILKKDCPNDYLPCHECRIYWRDINANCE